MKISVFLHLPQSIKASRRIFSRGEMSHRPVVSTWSAYDVSDLLSNEHIHKGVHVRVWADSEQRFCDGEGALELARLMMLHPEVSFSVAAPLDLPIVLRLQELGADALEIQVVIDGIEEHVQRPALLKQIVSLLEIPCWFELEKGVTCPQMLLDLFEQVS